MWNIQKKFKNQNSLTDYHLQIEEKLRMYQSERFGFHVDTNTYLWMVLDYDRGTMKSLEGERYHIMTVGQWRGMRVKGFRL